MSTPSAVLPRGRSAPPAPRDIPQHVSPGLWTLAWRRLKADRVGMVSLAIVLAFIAMMVFVLLLVEGLAWAWMKGLLTWR